MRTGKLFKIVISAQELLKPTSIHGMTHLRFLLPILIFQYFSNADQELLVALLRVRTYVRHISYLYPLTLAKMMCTYLLERK
jgi:hypothetical protein